MRTTTKKVLLTFVVLFLTHMTAWHGNAQTIANFDEIQLDPESYWNGADGSGGFVSGHIFFPNFFTWWTDELYSWSGFALSNITDNETPGFGNQYSAFTGGGYGENKNYAVAYVSDPVTFANSIFLVPNGPAKGGSLKDIVVTNTTYAALAMQNGDDFSKKFGGADGNDPDWFMLSLVGWRHGEAMEDKIVEFYLADYRFEDNSENYIIDTWERIEIAEMGPLDSLELRLSSSDVGEWGMNTPALICIGQITTMDNEDTTNTPFVSDVRDAVIYPNPFRDRVNVRYIGLSGSDQVSYRIADAAGRLLQSGKTSQGQYIDLAALPSGIYIMVLEGAHFRHTQKIIKK